MYRTISRGYALNAANRHMETKAHRRRMRQILREICSCAEEWFSGWWMA